MIFLSSLLIKDPEGLIQNIRTVHTQNPTIHMHSVFNAARQPHPRFNKADFPHPRYTILNKNGSKTQRFAYRPPALCHTSPARQSPPFRSPIAVEAVPGAVDRPPLPSNKTSATDSTGGRPACPLNDRTLSRRSPSMQFSAPSTHAGCRPTIHPPQPQREAAQHVP